MGGGTSPLGPLPWWVLLMLSRKLLCEARELRVLAACRDEEKPLPLFVLLALLTLFQLLMLTASSFCRSLGTGGGKTKSLMEEAVAV